MAVSNCLQESKHEIFEPSRALPAKDGHGCNPPERPSPPDKPLPSLPVVTVQTRSPTVRRSLIDASERPLRRSVSPSPGVMAGEEWPALFPSRPATPSIVQEKVCGYSLKQASSSTGKRLVSTAGTADYDHEQTCDFQHIPSAAAVQDSTPRRSSQAAAVHVQQSSADMPARIPSGNTREGLNPGKGPIEHLSSARDSPRSAAPDGAIFSPGNRTVSDLSNKSASKGSLSASDTELSQSGIGFAQSSRAGSGARPSRLPKRSSVPGPVRCSNSPKRSPSGRSSPYSSVSASVSRSLHSKHNHRCTIARRPVDQAKPQEAPDSVRDIHLKSDDVPLLAAERQLSKLEQSNRRRSSIPRRRHNVPLRETEKNEIDILVLNPSGKENGNGRMTDYKLNGGVVSVREDPQEEREDKAPRASGLATEHHEINKSLKLERVCPGPDYASGSPSEGNTPMLHTTANPTGRENLSLAASSNSQDKLGMTPDSASIVDPYFNTARQRQMIDKPFSRVKRLSATAPKHGPVLRISDSANRIIMGYESEESLDDDDAKVRKRNSLPDLRRSVVVKELRKSTEGLLNGLFPLTRSLTTRSLYRHEPKEEAGDRAMVRDPSSFRSELLSTAFTGTFSNSADPCSPCNGKIMVNSDDPGSKSSLKGPIDWPLKSPPQASPKLGLTEAHSFDDETPWIPPLQACHPAIGPEEKSPATIYSHRGMQSDTVNKFNIACKKSQSRVECSPNREAIGSFAVEKSSVPLTSNVVHSSVQKKTPFPPRTSSRSNTPDVSAQLCTQLNHVSSRDIPNRFESVRPNRLSQDFALPESTTAGPGSLRKSMYKLQGAETPKTSNQATRETAKVQLSSAKGILSNFKSLFYKRAVDTPTASTAAKTRSSAPREGPVMVAAHDSPCPNYRLRALPPNQGAKKKTHNRASVIPMPADTLPQTASPTEAFSPCLDSDDFCQANDLAMRLLAAARKEADSAERTKLLQVSTQAFSVTETNFDLFSQLGQLMVEAVSGARDAEKAMEEAKQAATLAEVHCMRSKKSVLALTRLVGKELDEREGRTL
jgi:hypothetical protein